MMNQIPDMMRTRVKWVLGVICTAFLVLQACDSGDPTPDNGETPPEPKTKIDYTVTGTYRTCEIKYAGEDGSDVDLGEIGIDWADSVKVPQSQQFLARLSATCADIERDGKATVAIAVEGEVRASDTVIGFGSSTSVQFLVMPR